MIGERSKLFFILTITTFALASLILDVFNYNPYKSNNYIFINFFVSLFFFIAGIMSLILYFVKFKLTSASSSLKISSSVRQALLLALIVVILALFKTLKLLDWWVGGPTILVVILLELFFRTASSARKKLSS